MVTDRYFDLFKRFFGHFNSAGRLFGIRQGYAVDRAFWFVDQEEYDDPKV